MRRRLLATVGLCLGVAFAAEAITPAYGQEKKPAAAAKDEARIDGTVKSVDKATKTLSVRLRGKNETKDVVYDDHTKFTFRNKPGTLDEVKEERRVICVGKLNDKGQLVATRIDVRDTM
jgi:hypothetical protein